MDTFFTITVAREMSGTTDDGNTDRSSAAWYAVYCKASRERQAASMLQDRLNVVVYLPEIRRRLHHKTLMVPFFPCYLFVKADLSRIAASSINLVSGVVHLVASDSAPQAIPNPIIRALRERIDTLNGYAFLPNYRFEPGDQARISHGPLQGLDVIFQGPTEPSARVRVLLEFLGQLRELELDVDLLEPVPVAARQPNLRRTRGKGRKIR